MSIVRYMEEAGLIGSLQVCLTNFLAHPEDILMLFLILNEKAALSEKAYLRCCLILVECRESLDL